MKLSRSWGHYDYAAVVVATTGIDVSTCRPVEIGVVRITGSGRVDRTWRSMVACPVPIPAAATRIHGITDVDVAKAPPADHVATVLREHLRDAIPIAHVRAYHSGVLRRVMPSALGDVPWICTRAMSVGAARSQQHALDVACAARDIRADRGLTHATQRAMMVARLFLAIMARAADHITAQDVIDRVAAIEGL